MNHNPMTGNLCENSDVLLINFMILDIHTVSLTQKWGKGNRLLFHHATFSGISWLRYHIAQHQYMSESPLPSHSALCPPPPPPPPPPTPSLFSIFINYLSIFSFSVSLYFTLSLVYCLSVLYNIFLSMPLHCARCSFLFLLFSFVPY